MPSVFSDESIDYLTKVLETHWDDEIEHGQIFKFTTGKRISIEFEGTPDEVEIIPSLLTKPFEKMSLEELAEYVHNPKKFMKIVRVMKRDHLAMQHHHTRYGLYAPSGEDVFSLMNQHWTDYSVVLSQGEIWVIETKGTFNTRSRENMKNILKERENLAKSVANSKFKKYSEDWWNEVNKTYSRDVENFINNMNQDNIKVYRVIL